MLEFRTQGFNGYSVKYSPFFDSRIAVASAANFGLVGNGRLYVLGLTANGVVAEKYFDTQDSLFDTAWSEAHENQLLTAGGDGSVKLFDITLDQFPVQSWQEHAREVFAVHWNLVGKDTFLSSSWDGTVRQWDLRGGQEVRRFGHRLDVNGIAVSRLGDLLLAGSDDHNAYLWNVTTGEEVRRFTGHTGFVRRGIFSADDTRVVTAGDDSTVRLWDVADPAHAPGTGTPEMGGFTSREALFLVRALSGLDFVGADLVEVAPPLDPSGITALAGATLAFEILCLLAQAVAARRN